MDEVTKNKWKELREEVHGKEEVNLVHVVKAFSYTWDNAVWLGRMTERRLFMAITRGLNSTILRQNRAIKSLVKSSFELDDPREIKRKIEYAVCAFDDRWEAQINREFVTELAAIAVEAN